jgi:hypothetical protein
VGWTRARDRLVFAAQDGTLCDGILGVLDPSAICEPPADSTRVVWGGCEVSIAVQRCARAETAPPELTPGYVTRAREGGECLPGRLLPSTAEPVACERGEIVVIGDRIDLDGEPDLTAIGDAIHAFLAVDAGDCDLASTILHDHRVAAHLAVEDLVAIADRLQRWTMVRYPGMRIYREWPIHHRLTSGTVVVGTIDLLLLGSKGAVVIDHKAFPGRSNGAVDRALRHSGQLDAYATALDVPILATWIHFPLRGELIEVRLKDGAG